MNPETAPDPFALLGLVPRPKLDPETLEKAFTERAAATHPDQPSGNEQAAANLTTAYRQLKSPSSRLALLLDPHHQSTRPAAVPEPWGNLLLRVGDWSRRCDLWLAAHQAPLIELEKVLAAAEGTPLLEQLHALRAELATLEESLHLELDQLDQAWQSGLRQPERLSDLRQRFAFAEKIRTRLDERFLRLAEVIA